MRKQTLGAMIDSFPKVVRFNGFVIAGFEAQVGTKTDIWIRQPWCKDVREAPEKYVKKSKNRPDPPFKWIRDDEKLMDSAGETYIEYICGVAPKDKCYSTGLVTLAYFSMLYDCVHIVGFDGLRTRTHHHYYEDKSVNELHMPDRERKFVEFLESLERCKRL